MGTAIKNPQFGIWLNNDDTADEKYKKSGGGSVQTYLPELETVNTGNRNSKVCHSSDPEFCPLCFLQRP